MFFPNEIAGLINFGNSLPKIYPKAPPDIIFLICALLNFISADMLLFIEFLNLVISFVLETTPGVILPC